METMTPLDFLDFRNYLFPASGFQSFQFRELEVMLGLKNEKRHTYNNTPYAEVFNTEKKTRLQELEEGQSLLQLVEKWLERIPFLEMDGFDFIAEYKKSVVSMVEKEKKAIMETDVLSQEYKEMRVRMLGDTNTFFAAILDENTHNKMIEEGQMMLSYKATQAALFINLYREQPILQMPFQFLQKLTEIDENLTTWRYRHAQMVLRMLGKKIGTGGSSGHEYLAKTARKHHIFLDLQNISTLLIPRSDLPILPEKLIERLGFKFNNPM
jgi:tryptophan 2,3-dioxygenase